MPLNVIIETKLKFDDSDIETLKLIGKIGNLSFKEKTNENVISFVISGMNIHVINEGIIDFDAKIKTLEEQNEKLINEISRSYQMLSNSNFVDRAPKDKLDAEKKKAFDYIEQYNESIKILQELGKNLESVEVVKNLNALLKGE